jgi:hypothetical protein
MNYFRETKGWFSAGQHFGLQKEIVYYDARLLKITEIIDKIQNTWIKAKRLVNKWLNSFWLLIYDNGLDVHGSVHHNTNLIEMTNKMQICRTICYSIVPWLLNMFRAILPLIIRSFQTVITASGFTHVCRCRPLSWQGPATTNVCKNRSCNYSLEAPDDER